MKGTRPTAPSFSAATAAFLARLMFVLGLLLNHARHIGPVSSCCCRRRVQGKAGDNEGARAHCPSAPPVTAAAGTTSGTRAPVRPLPAHPRCLFCPPAPPAPPLLITRQLSHGQECCRSTARASAAEMCTGWSRGTAGGPGWARRGGANAGVESAATEAPLRRQRRLCHCKQVLKWTRGAVQQTL